jgi:hypothetical protein
LVTARQNHQRQSPVLSTNLDGEQGLLVREGQLSDWRPVFANRDEVAFRDGGQEFGEMGLASWTFTSVSGIDPD